MENKTPTTVANEVVKQELANKNSLDLTTTDNVAVANRLKAIDTLGVVIKNNLIEGINEDYAVIPNTSKPALLLPGARKICMLYGLIAQYPVMDIKENIILTKCELYYQGNKVSESYGSESIGKKRDIGWEQNKAIKIAQKRAFVGATLQIANLSKLFTQDTEDMNSTPVKEYSEQEKKNTYAIANWFYKFKQMFFTRATAKNCWAKFVERFKEFADLKKLDNENVYELGCDSKLAEEFKKAVETNNGLFKIESFEFEVPAKEGK